MDEDALRAIVREAVARHLGGAESGSLRPTMLPLADASHYRYKLPKSGGPCLIEPTVPCNQCGYCESHGH
jgi:hypothetical protein